MQNTFWKTQPAALHFPSWYIFFVCNPHLNAPVGPDPTEYAWFEFIKMPDVCNILLNWGNILWNPNAA